LDGLDQEVQASGMQQSIRDYLKHHMPTLTPSVAKEQERMFSKIAKVFSKFAVHEVRPKNVQIFLDAFNTKPTARQSYKYRLSAFFSWCVIQELCETNPLREIRVDGPPRTRTPWTDDLFWAAHEKMEPMMQCYHELSVLMFQRPTDIRHLMQSQRRDGMIRFEPSKTTKSSGAMVDIPVTPVIDKVWKRAQSLCKLSAGPGGDAPLIQTSDGSPYTRSGIYSAYRRADEEIVGKDAKGKQRPLIGLNPKSLRPYATTAAIRAGYNLPQLKIALAHMSEATTEGYVQGHGVPVSEVAMELPKKPENA
jgi:hypothetical protein